MLQNQSKENQKFKLNVKFFQDFVLSNVNDCLKQFQELGLLKCKSLNDEAYLDENYYYHITTRKELIDRYVEDISNPSLGIRNLKKNKRKKIRSSLEKILNKDVTNIVVVEGAISIGDFQNLKRIAFYSEYITCGVILLNCVPVIDAFEDCNTHMRLSGLSICLSNQYTFKEQ